MLAAADSRAVQSELWPWILLLLLMVAAGAVLIAVLRRLARDGDDAPPQGFSLQQLRDLRRRGQITDEEYERARGLLVSGMTGRASSGSGNDAAGGAAEPRDERQ